MIINHSQSFYIEYNHKHSLTNNQLRRKDWFQDLNHNSGHTRMPSTLLHQGLHQQRFSSLCWPRFSRRRIPTPAYRILIINYQSQFFCCFYNASWMKFSYIIAVVWLWVTCPTCLHCEDDERGAKNPRCIIPDTNIPSTVTYLFGNKIFDIWHPTLTNYNLSISIQCWVKKLKL